MSASQIPQVIAIGMTLVLAVRALSVRWPDRRRLAWMALAWAGIITAATLTITWFGR